MEKLKVCQCRSNTAIQSTQNDFTNWRIGNYRFIVCNRSNYTFWTRFYHCKTGKIYRFLISPCQRILKIGCGNSDLLASLKPSLSIDVDFSPETIDLVRERHPESLKSSFIRTSKMRLLTVASGCHQNRTGSCVKIGKCEFLRHRTLRSVGVSARYQAM